MIVPLFVADLEFSFVQDLHYDLILSQSLKSVLYVFLLSKLSLLHICEYLLNLQYFSQIAFLLCPPIHNLVVVARKFELLPSLLQPHHCHIGEQLLVHGVFNH